MLGLLVVSPLVVMGVLTKTVLIPALKDPEAAYYNSSKGYPAKQRVAGKPIEVEVATMTSDLFEDSLAAPGEVIAQAQVEMRPTVAGLIQEVYFEEGEWVKEGQLLMQLDPGKLEHEVEIARLNLEMANANLVAVQSSREASLNHLRSNIKINQTQLASAEERLNSLLQFVSSQQSIDLNSLQVQLDNAQTRLDNSRTLVDRGALAQIQLQEAEDNLAKIQREFLIAQQGSLSTQNTLHDVRNSIIRHRQNLQQAQEALTRAMELENVRQEKAQLTVENRETLLAEALRALDQTLIYASTSGLLSKMNVDKGEFIHPNTSEPAMVMAQDMLFQAYVDQARLHDVQVGDRTVVRLVAYPGQTFEGRVIRVNPAIETEDFIPGRVGIDRQYTYSVWIDVPSLELSPGLQGYMHLTKTQTRVSVPESAVKHLSGGEGMVMVVEADRAVVRSLELGALQDNQRKVINGLSLGDQVIVYPNGLEPGDRVHAIETKPSQT